jgi:hypothetical protein
MILNIEQHLGYYNNVTETPIVHLIMLPVFSYKQTYLMCNMSSTEVEANNFINSKFTEIVSESQCRSAYGFGVAFLSLHSLR